ncbi:aminotransferase YbdL, partial [Escherichia coli KTE120]
KTVQKWNWPHSRGWTGITIDDCWKGWAILLRQKQKKLIMLPSETMIWQPEFTDKTLSRKPGAVHGWKVGYCVAPAPISAEIRKVHQYLTFSVNTPAQLALADMLRAEPEHYLALPDFYRQKRDILVNALNESRLEILPCEGTYFLLVDYSAVSTLDDVEFCQWLTQEHGVAAIPLSVFCADPFPHKLIRLCFAKKESTLLAAAERLRQL